MLIDLGGVLVPDYLPAAAAAWSIRLGITQRAFLGALFGGSDDQVLTGRVSEPAWWGHRCRAARHRALTCWPNCSRTWHPGRYG